MKMKQIKILIVNIFLLTCLIISNSYSKALPPGSGTADVPANVLILLDKSGSMGWSSVTGANIGYPYTVTPISNTGNYIVHNGNVFMGVNHSANAKTSIVKTKQSFAYRRSSNPECSTYYGYGKNVLYHNSEIYFIGKNWHGANPTLCKVNTTTATVTQIKKFSYRYSKLGMQKHNNIIFAIDSYNRQIFIYDTSTGRSTNCSTSSTLRDVIDKSYSGLGGKINFTLDASGNLVFYHAKNRHTTSALVKFSRSGLNCPTNNPSLTKTGYVHELFNNIAMVAHPFNDDIIYALDRSSRLVKVNFKTMPYTIERVGRNGRVNAQNYNPTSKAAIRFARPRDIKIDTDLNRIFVADSDNRMVQTFGLSLNYLDHSGYAVRRSRMAGAQEAIQAIVTDSSLGSSVNFGFGYWSHDASGTIYYGWRQYNRNYKRCSTYIGNPSWLTRNHWLVRRNLWCYKPNQAAAGYTSWNTSKDEAVPCDNQNCLKIKVNRDGAKKINQYIKSVRPGGGTDANTWASIAKDYYLSKDTPIDSNSPCQGSYVIVIGDGDWYNQPLAVAKVQDLLKKNIKTFTIAYGGGVTRGGLRAFNIIAKEGGTDRAIKADTPDQLKAQLSAAIRSVIATTQSFTAPAITAKVNQGGSLFQAQFKYQKNMEWRGTLTRTAISAEGDLDDLDKKNWNASQVVPSPNARKIWGIIPGTDYKTDYNNYVESNSSLIKAQFDLFGLEVGDYHRKTPKVTGVTGNTRCSAKGDSTSTIADGNADDIKGLINFSRGTDYFDYDGDCKLKGERVAAPYIDKNGKTIFGRKNYLGDIFHSEMVVVGAPSADTSFTSQNQESYWRSIKGYDAWAKSLAGREERIYVGGNDGMLHSFDSETGEEKWAFIPPFVMSKLPLLVNENLNNDLAPQKGGTNAIYGVDGSPVVHDMFFKSPLGTSENWHTILMVPYGRGGNGFTVLDITDPDKPLHLYSVYNDHVRNKVYVMNHLDVLSEYEYIDDTYSIAELEESIAVQDNYNNDNNINDECKSDTTTSCYEGRTWTFPIAGLSKSDFIISLNNKNIPNFTVQTSSSGKTEITLPTQIFYQANGDRAQSTDTLVIKLTNAAINTLSINLPEEYNYKELGETWSSPRIFRLPTDGPKDKNIQDDVYVAVMGGGYGGRDDGVGSALFVINLQDNATPGKVEKVIEVRDNPSIDIINSIPGSPVVITPDTSRGIKFRGALVYTNDFEGKITKYNLTNMEDDGSRNPIKLYDHTTLLSIDASTINGRYQYHSMDAGIGKTSKNMWLFSGTGDYERLTYRDTKLNNIMYGYRDTDFPLYKNRNDATADLLKLDRCSNTTNDSTKVDCPLTTNKFGRKSRAKKDQGWFIELPSSQKITAEPTLSNGLVYFPIFEPSQSANKCSLGLALICAVDDECGTNVSTQLNGNKSLKSQTIDGKVYAGKTCKAVGLGVLSRIVVFANKMFANIAGKSTQLKEDLVIIDSGMGDVSSFRNSWREGNF